MYINYMHWDVTNPAATPAALARAYARGDVLITSNNERLKNVLHAELVTPTNYGARVELIWNRGEHAPWTGTVAELYHDMCKRVHDQVAKSPSAQTKCKQIIDAYAKDFSGATVLSIQRYHEFIGGLCDALNLRGFMDAGTKVFFYSTRTAEGIFEQKRHSIDNSMPMPMFKGTSGSRAELPLDAISRTGSIKIPAGTVMTTGNEKLYAFTDDTVPVYIADASAAKSSASYRLLAGVDLTYPCILYSNKQADFVHFMSMSPNRTLVIFVGGYPHAPIAGDIRCVIRLPIDPNSADPRLENSLRNPDGKNANAVQPSPPAAFIDLTGEKDGDDDDSDDDDDYHTPQYEPPSVMQEKTKKAATNHRLPHRLLLTPKRLKRTFEPETDP